MAVTIFDNSVLRILRSFGNIDLDYFNSRLRLQKIGYLAQRMGIEGGFPYSWYLRGPYSSSLTSVLYQGEEMDVFKDQPTLNEKESHVIQNIKDLLGNGIDDIRELELYASVWYLMPERKSTRIDLDAVLEIMHNEKPQYSDTEIATAFDKILTQIQE